MVDLQGSLVSKQPLTFHVIVVNGRQGHLADSHRFTSRGCYLRPQGPRAYTGLDSRARTSVTAATPPSPPRVISHHARAQRRQDNDPDHVLHAQCTRRLQGLARALSQPRGPRPAFDKSSACSRSRSSCPRALDETFPFRRLQSGHQPALPRRLLAARARTSSSKACWTDYPAAPSGSSRPRLITLPSPSYSLVAQRAADVDQRAAVSNTLAAPRAHSTYTLPPHCARSLRYAARDQPRARSRPSKATTPPSTS
mmetsp:Transcript_7756/g.18418  ORF Transcript_7756/g.18418 Transcript_7756/m.18418 type:complete len:254 (+) Transcript_7756:174-935(+)